MSSLRVINRIDDCDDGRRRLIDLNARRLLVIHRCGLGEDAVTIAEKFKAIEATGYQTPYTFVVRTDGQIEQALALADYGPHAKRWNNMGIGLAVVGDFRRESPTLLQWDSVIRLCSAFAGWATEGVKGHDELPDGTSDKTKQCPGRHFDMDVLRDSIRDRAALKLLDARILF